MRSSSALELKSRERSWRKSLGRGGYDTISFASNKAGSRASIASLQSLDDMVTSGALYRKRYSGVGETRSMTGGFDPNSYNISKEVDEDVRSLHFSYSVTSETRPPSRSSSFRSRRGDVKGKEIDARSLISDGVANYFSNKPSKQLQHVFSLILISKDIQCVNHKLNISLGPYSY